MTRKGKRQRPNPKGRNETEQFIPLPYGMVRSAAFRNLGGNALKVWIEIRARYNGGNNGKLTLSLDEAARLLGMGKATAQRAFEELEGKGFLKMTKRGQWYGRRATEYASTDRPCNGHLASHDWKRWSTELGAKNKSSVL